MRMLRPLFSCLLLLLPAPAFAGDWRAFIDDTQSLACYATAAPDARKIVSKLGSKAVIGSEATGVFITHRPGEKQNYVFSYMPDFKLADKSPVKLKIDNKEFTLYTAQNAAWARKPEIDRQIFDLMKDAHVLRVMAEDASGTIVTDIFSLNGSERALTAAAKMCGLPAQ